MTEDQVKQLIDVALREHSLVAWKEIGIAALGSPVVALLIVLIMAVFLKKPIALFLASRSIQLRWGDKEIKLSELSNSLDKELDPLKEDIEALKSKVDEIEAARGGAPEKPVAAEEAPGDVQHIRDRMYKALASPKFRWRSIESLAKFARTSEEQIMELIESEDKVVLGQDKHGNRLAKLRHR